MKKLNSSSHKQLHKINAHTSSFAFQLLSHLVGHFVRESFRCYQEKMTTTTKSEKKNIHRSGRQQKMAKDGSRMISLKSQRAWKKLRKKNIFAETDNKTHRRRIDLELNFSSSLSCTRSFFCFVLCVSYG